MKIIRVNSTEYLITTGLGYCCMWKFFSLYHDTALIAARLGVSERSIRRYKAAAAEGELCCNDCPNCMKSYRTPSCSNE